MGLGVQATGGCYSTTHVAQLPIGVLSAQLGAMDTSGKRPVVTFGGRVHDKTGVDVTAVRTDLKSRQVFIQIGSHKKDGTKGKISDYSRSISLDQISTKLARIHGGEKWTVHLVDANRKTLDSQSYAIP